LVSRIYPKIMEISSCYSLSLRHPSAAAAANRALSVAEGVVEGSVQPGSRRPPGDGNPPEVQRVAGFPPFSTRHPELVEGSVPGKFTLPKQKTFSCSIPKIPLIP
jgi:hypothetical protein